MKEFIFLFYFFLPFVFGVVDENQAPTTRPPLQVEELPWLTFFDRKSSSDDFGGRKSGRTNLGLASYSTLCPPGETGQFPYPPDCKRFINCWKGRGSVQVCAPGTLFNPETNECDFPGKVKCEDGDQIPMPTGARYVRFPELRPEIAHNPRIARKNQNVEQSKPDSVPARPYPGRPPYFGPSHLKPPTRPSNQSRGGEPQCALGATGLYPHPFDCTKFLKCWSGNTFIHSCGPGTFFNPLMSTCDHPRNVPCAHEETFQPEIPAEVAAEEEQIPEESVQYEQYQDINQGVKTTGIKGGKKTTPRDPESPNYEEVTQTEQTATPHSEVDDLNPPVVQENSTHRKPKVINIGGSHQQNQFSSSHGKEPASYLTPPQYDVYGNVIPTNGHDQAALGVQPNHVGAQNSPKTPPQNLPFYNPFLNYPAQGPYSSPAASGHYKPNLDSDKHYYGYLLNKKHSHQQQQQQNHPVHPHQQQQQQQNHPLHPHQQQQQNHPVHPQQQHPQHPHHTTHPAHYHPYHPHHPEGDPPTWLVPPPFQHQHFPHYAPNHPFFPKGEMSTPYILTQGPYYAEVMQIPYYPVFTGSRPCPSASASKDENQNEPSAPECEPGLSFYKPGGSDGPSKPSDGTQVQNNKPPTASSNHPSAYPPSIYPQRPAPGSSNFLPGVYYQRPSSHYPQYQPGYQFGQPDSNGQVPLKPSPASDHRPGSPYDPQLQFGSHQQSGNSNPSPAYPSGSTHGSKPDGSEPQSNAGSASPSALPQIPNGVPLPESGYNPQASANYPQQPSYPQYRPGSYYGPQVGNQNVDSRPQSSTEKIYPSSQPQNPGQNRPPQYHPYPFNYYPVDPNLYPQFFPGYHPSQSTPQTPPNSPNHPSRPTEQEQAQGQVPVPAPFSTTRPSAPSYVDASLRPTKQTPEGQVQVEDPFFTDKNYIDKDYDHQPSEQRPVYRPTKTSENIQGCDSSHHCTGSNPKESQAPGSGSNVISAEPLPPQTATFPPFPGHTQKPKSDNIKTAAKSKPKEYLLGKIDVRVKEEETSEDVESVPTTTQPPRKKGSERLDEVFIKENPKKPIHTLPDKYSQPEDSNDVDAATESEVKGKGEEEADRKTIRPESDFEGVPQEEEKPKKINKKPFIKVRHPPANAQTVRLRNGASHLDGYLEMRDEKSKWGLVCDNSGGWGIAEATVACRGLGFVRGAELSWQGYPIKSDSEDLHVAVHGINCTGKETSLSDCKTIHRNDTQCDIGRNAVGLRCFDNLASHCQPGEILYNQHCYKLHGKENPDDPWIKVEDASQQCKKFGGKLVDITSQNENDFLSEWLIKKYPDVTAVATGGIGMLVLGRPIWVWEGASDPTVYEKWWSAWSGNQNVPKSSINGPLCIVLRKTISCTEGDSEGQKNAEAANDEETCFSDYFFWDVEDCENIRTSVFICERPMDDIGCVVGNGEGYVGTANTTASGLPCLPWDHPKVVEGLARRGPQERSSRLAGHNYCRNLGNPDRHPWCFVEGKGNSEYCAIPQCWDSVSGYSRSSGSWPSCDQNHFECKPGECVKKEWVCDGQKDCTNGRDEEACKVFIQEFSTVRNRKMRGKGNERWPNVNENTCAKLCLENKNFKCKSFSYNSRERDCLLSDTNVGLSGQVVNARGWTYHERTTESLRCTIENGFFGCQNGKCVNVSNVCDGKKNCEDGSDEKDCGRLGYAIRLAGSQERHRGRVEVKILGKWGVICDDMFDMRDAEVVCRELGFKLGAAEVLKHSEYPVENPLFLIDHLDCLGNETSVKECPFPGWGKHNCGPEEVVGVSCRVPGLECPEGQWQCKRSKECISLAYLCDDLKDCDDNSDEDKPMCASPTQIRLAGGPNSTSGRLEIRRFDLWGTVCHDDFSAEAAHAVCSLLGYNGPSAVKKAAYFGAGSGPIWLDGGLCFVNETDLTECTKTMGVQNNCKHDEDVSVVCSQQESHEKSSAVRPIAASSSDDSSRRSEEKLRQVLISECSGKPKTKARVLQNYEKVVGGTDVAREALPWQASVRVRSGGGKSVHWCGAIVISPYHVLTAGHCLRDYNKAAYFIRVGDYDTKVPDPHEQEFGIEHLYMHPEFSKNINLNNDIGLVKIKGEIPLGEHIRPACLAPSLDLYQPGLNCSVSGWGSVSANSAGYARTLRRAFIPILEPSLCRAPFVYGESLSEGMFCAGHLDGGVDSCQGDSGGPLMCQHEGREYLFGITSWGHGCGRANKPGVYTNVAHYADWIQQKIQSSLL